MPSKRANHLGSSIGNRLFVYMVYAVLSIIVLIPFFWIITTALKTYPQIFAFPPKWIPNPATVDNFVTLFTRTSIPRQVINSIFVGLMTVVVTIVLSALAAYGFSRFSFKRKTFFFILLITFQLLPATINVVPYYFLGVRLQLLNSYAILILIFTSLRIPVCTLILKGFFDTIPISIEEAATIDGASRIQVLLKIISPISLPGIASAALLSFIFTWNRFLLPLILNSKPKMTLATVGVFQLASDEALSWHLIASGTLFSILPLIILFLATQNMFISGLTKGTGK